ncbi:IS1096 element passenger TnpR family protein [Caldanaerobius fijiensis]
MVEKVLDLEEGVKYPVCIGGKRNCPPEDIGGRGDMRIF